MMTDARILHQECRSKLAWSHRRLSELNSDIERFVQGMEQGKTYDIVAERDEATGFDIQRLRVYSPPPVIRWRLMAGDVIHNMRSSLDNLIEALTVLEQGHALRDTAFPIFIDEDTFHGRGRRNVSGLRRIRGLSPAARALIEEAQPYKRGHLHIRHALWTINELWNADKHRAPAVLALGGFTLGMKSSILLLSDAGGIGRGSEVQLKREVPFVDGAEIGRARVVGHDAELVVEGQVAFRVTFEKAAPGYGEDVVLLLAQCLDWVVVLFKQVRPQFR